MKKRQFQEWSVQPPIKRRDTRLFDFHPLTRHSNDASREEGAADVHQTPTSGQMSPDFTLTETTAKETTNHSIEVTNGSKSGTFSPTREMIRVSASCLTTPHFKVHAESPWTKYEAELKVYAGHIANLVYKDGKRFLVYSIPKDHREVHLWALQTLSMCQQSAFMQVVDAFDTTEGLFVVTEYLWISLAKIAISQLKKISEDKLASIAIQLLDALVFMVEQKLLHDSLSSESVLVHEDGSVKLAPPKFWRKAGDADVETICLTFLNNVLVQLMEKDSLSNPIGRIKLRNPESWSSTAQDFMRKLNHLPVSVSSLRKHDFVREVGRASLGRLVHLGELKAFHWMFPALNVNQTTKMRTVIQQQAENYEQGIAHEYRRFFRGVGRVRLDSLTFTTLAPLNQENVQRLRRIFAKQGCLHALPDYRILVLLSQRQFAAALALLSITPEQFRTPSGDHDYELVSPLGDVFRCCQGRHRVEAGKQVLQTSDRWWSAYILVSDEPETVLVRELTECFGNEAPPNDGLIYIGIRTSQRDNMPGIEAKWWSYLSKKRSQYLKQFLKQTSMVVAVDQLIQYECVMLGWCNGVLHKVCASRCDPELISYINTMYEFYRDLVDGYPKLIDEHDVKLMEGRCPKFSISDKAFLEKEFWEGRLFSLVGDPSRREAMWRFICNYDRLILSFKVFFQDFLYITHCRNVLSLLLEPISVKSTLQDTYRELFTGSASYQVTEQSFETQTYHDQFIIAWIALWMLSMRCWSDILGVTRRGKSPLASHLPEVSSFVPFTLSSVATTAQRLGFSIPPLMNNDYGNSGPTSIPDTVSMTTDEKMGCPLVRERIGVPFKAAEYADRNGIFFPILVNGPERRAELTILFARWSFLLALFGPQVQSAMQQETNGQPHSVLQQSLARQNSDHGVDIDPDSVDVSMTGVPSTSAQQAMSSTLRGGPSDSAEIQVYMVASNEEVKDQHLTWGEFQQCIKRDYIIFMDGVQKHTLPRQLTRTPKWILLAENGCKMYKYAVCHKGQTITATGSGPWFLLQQIGTLYPDYRIFIGSKPTQSLPEPSNKLDLIMFAHPAYRSQPMRDNQAGIS